MLFEIDDVIDPADTRGLIAATLAAAGRTPPPASGSWTPGEGSGDGAGMRLSASGRS